MNGAAEGNWLGQGKATRVSGRSRTAGRDTHGQTVWIARPIRNAVRKSMSSCRNEGRKTVLTRAPNVLSAERHRYTLPSTFSARRTGIEIC